MKKWKDFIPSIIGFLASMIGLIVYLVTTENFSFLICIQILAVPIILLLVQGLNMTKKIYIPVLFNYLLL
ncbi:MAG: hypothetical protein K2O23_00730, partial [Anaeroplasmataceae bacterium]|nr:hypothetical protein [Anaeroplasmataceae bacterium]